MMGRTHALAALAAGGAALGLGLTPKAEAPVVLGLALVGGWLPDIDHWNSKAGRLFAPVTRPLAVVVQALFGHRTVTHSLLALGVLGWTAWTLGGPAVGTGLLLGYGSHLLADALTPAGVPLLWPVKWRVGLGLVRTGGAAETVFLGLVLGVGLAAFAAGL